MSKPLRHLLYVSAIALLWSMPAEVAVRAMPERDDYCGDSVCQDGSCNETQNQGDGCRENSSNCPQDCEEQGGPACTDREGFGVVTSLFNSPFATSTASLGVGSVRLGLYWDIITTSSGPWDWSSASNITNARNAGMNMLVTLNQPPHESWVYGTCNSDPNCIASYYYDFVHYAIDNYGGSDVTWGIMNEPDIDTYINFLDYLLYFEAADDARDAVDTNARLAGPETTSDGSVGNG